VRDPGKGRNGFERLGENEIIKKKIKQSGSSEEGCALLPFELFYNFPSEESADLLRWMRCCREEGSKFL
jgi:hypothetical protein